MEDYERQGLALKEENSRCRVDRQSLEEAALALQTASVDLQQEAEQVGYIFIYLCTCIYHRVVCYDYVLIITETSSNLFLDSLRTNLFYYVFIYLIS